MFNLLYQPMEKFQKTFTEFFKILSFGNKRIICDKFLLKYYSVNENKYLEK